ncbi:MAG: tetratricopeptide repeat protein, partial [Acidobacteria bacterium]|nr:tetratricopeptide repeat protein [Acidobacteriota bacterium]
MATVGRVRARASGDLLATTLAALAGCATTPPQVVYEPEAMRAEIARRVGPGHGTVEIPYEIDPALVELVREKTRGAPAGRARLAAIVDAVLVKHDLGVTADASRVFEERRGDCISATSLFVGLARAVGMEVVFVEAVGIEDVSAEESLDIYHRHVMAAWGPSPRATLVDFNRIGTEYVRFRVMSDLEALAHFHNTQGYQALRRDDLAEARRRFEIAVALAPELAWARNNLGVALRRTGDLENAEASFRQAISADPAYSSAYANLARLLEGQRRFDEARAMRELA